MPKDVESRSCRTFARDRVRFFATSSSGAAEAASLAETVVDEGKGSLFYNSLDPYSNTVCKVVDEVGPSVVSIGAYQLQKCLGLEDCQLCHAYFA